MKKILIKWILKILSKNFDGSKKEITKFVIQVIISILSAVLTARKCPNLGTKLHLRPVALVSVEFL